MILLRWREDLAEMRREERSCTVSSAAEPTRVCLDMFARCSGMEAVVGDVGVLEVVGVVVAVGGISTARAGVAVGISTVRAGVAGVSTTGVGVVVVSEMVLVVSGAVVGVASGVEVGVASGMVGVAVGATMASEEEESFPAGGASTCIGITGVDEGVATLIVARIAGATAGTKEFDRAE